MRILHLIDHLGLGGAQTALADLTASWPEPSDEIEIVSLGRSDDFASRFPARGNLRVRILGGRRWDTRVMWKAHQIIKAGNYDIVHAHLTKSVCTIALTNASAHAKVLAHIRNDVRYQPFVMRSMLKKLSHAGTDFVAVSEQSRRSACILLKLLPERVHTVYNSRHFPVPSEDARTSIRAQLGIEASTFVLAFVGRFVRQKNLGLLLQAYRQFHERQANSALLLLGNGPLKRQTEQHAIRLSIENNCRFVGFQKNVEDWITAADVGVLSSNYEGLPMAAAEIMAQGKPMVATDVGGTSEIAFSGQTGILVPPRNIECLVEAMRTLAENTQLRTRIGNAAQEQVRKVFSPDLNSHRLRDLYTSLNCHHQDTLIPSLVNEVP